MRVYARSIYRGSFIALLKRGLIDAKFIVIQGIKSQSWYVTTEGLKALNKMGFYESCELELDINCGKKYHTLIKSKSQIPKHRKI